MALPVEPDDPVPPDAPATESGDWAAIATFAGGVTEYKPVNFSALVDNGSINLAGNYVIVSVSSGQIILSNPNLVNADWDDLTEATVYSSPSLNTTGEVWVGWFDVDATDMDYVIFNVIAAQGMYGINKKGEQYARAETAYVEMVPITKDGTVLGSTEVFTKVLTGSGEEKEQVAMTIWATPATSSRYKARMKRSTPTDLDPKRQAIDEMKWESCYGLAAVQQDHFGDVTTVFSRTYSTASATAVKERRFNLLATRKIPEWNGTAFVGLEPQTSAAPIICAMALDPYIGNRSIDELNVEGIYDEIEAILAYFGFNEAGQFNYTFDDDNISFEETVQTVAQTVFSTAYRLGNVLNLYAELANPPERLLFNHRNKLPKSETRTVTFGPTNDYDGVELTYVDPNDDVEQTIYIPDDQSARNPKKIESIGVRNERQAMLHAQRAYNKIIYQNTTTQFDCLEEAEYLINNNRILVADNTRADTKDGYVKGQIGLVLQLSQPFVGIPGVTYTIFLQHTDGSVEAIECEPGADQWQVVLADAPSLPLSLGEEQSVVAQYWIVGDNEPRAVSFLLTEKEPSGKNTYSVTAINYDGRYYLHDTLYKWGPIVAISTVVGVVEASAPFAGASLGQSVATAAMEAKADFAGVALGAAVAAGAIDISYEAEALALFARMTVAASYDRKADINRLIIALKDAGIWSKLDVLYLLAAHNAQAARLNWISSSYDITLIGSPTFTTDRGYAGNGTTTGLDSNWTPSASSVYLQDSATMGCYLNAGTDTAANNAVVMGASVGTSAISSFVAPRSSAGFIRGRINQATSVDANVAVATRMGHTALVRTASNLVTAYRNGAATGTFTTVSTTRPTSTMYICGLNQAGFLSPVDNRIACAYAGAGLTGAEQTALDSALHTFLAVLGAN